MSYVGDAFDNLRQALEITTTEQNLASSRREAIYNLVKDHWDVTAVFLTGSYDRHTKTKKLKDVDIFVVIDPNGRQAGLANQTPSGVLNALKAILEKKYEGNVKIDGPACVVSFGSEEITSFEIVPAFAKTVGFRIPDSHTGAWMLTDPSQHATATTAKNKACGSKWVPFVKMVKGINREAGEPIKPSFLIEVMALDLVREPFGRYQDEIATFLASAAEQITKDWADPAGLGPVVNADLNTAQRQSIASALRSWQQIAERAIDLEDDGKQRPAVEAWRELFGNRMPRP